MIIVPIVSLLSMMTIPQRATDTQIRRAAGSQSLDSLRDAVRSGWTASDIDMQAQSGGKSAFHMAAWKGSLENVKYLVELGCDINSYSTGEYSYGKTAIFFASTRSRNEVVDYLLDRGAKVCIVNNKGQSVLSIAASHLHPDIVEKIQQQERREATEEWWNFRASHSDGLEYGDLDPRFLDRDLRHDHDIVTPLSINPTTKQTRKGGFARRNPKAAAKQLEQLAEKKKKRAQKDSVQRVVQLSKTENQELEQAWELLLRGLEQKNEEQEDGNHCLLYNHLLKVIQLGQKIRKPWISEAANKLVQAATSVVRVEELIEDTIKRTNDSSREFQLLKKLLLKINNGADSNAKTAQKQITAQYKEDRPTTVTDFRLWREACSYVKGLSMSMLENDDDNNNNNNNNNNGNACSDNSNLFLSLEESPIFIDSVSKISTLENDLKQCRIVAIDTEWCDSDGSDNNGIDDHQQAIIASTIQIAFPQKQTSNETLHFLKTYVVDLLPTSLDYRRAAQQLIRGMFVEESSSSNTIVLGFALGNDIPVLEHFVQQKFTVTTATRVLDMQQMMTEKGSPMPGLKACVAQFSQTPLSKEEQCSDWAKRPLSQSQLNYAGLDAAVLLVLLAEKSREIP